MSGFCSSKLWAHSPTRRTWTNYDSGLLRFPRLLQAAVLPAANSLSSSARRMCRRNPVTSHSTISRVSLRNPAWARSALELSSSTQGLRAVTSAHGAWSGTHIANFLDPVHSVGPVAIYLNQDMSLSFNCLGPILLAALQECQGCSRRWCGRRNYNRQHLNPVDLAVRRL